MPTENSSSCRHFVLVHGGNIGAWCWYKLKILLEEAGHNVTAFDLAASGRNLEPLNNLQTIDDYHEPLYSYMAALAAKDRVILVGHSSGGYAVCSAMERFPSKIALAVFVTAGMVGPNLTADQIQEKISSLERPDDIEDNIFTVYPNGNIDLLLGPEFMIHKMYNQSPPEDYTLARLLTRVIRTFNDEKSRLELLVSKERYGSVPRAYFIATEDNLFSIEIQRWLIETNPPNEVREIRGADHMVMFSKPSELCNNLIQVTMKYF
uniref:Polyneudridine aldehyde esterase-like 1 n=1 Tax=Tabernanthe iboga TaxID=141617 RepID=PNAE1_TABIB|nr:esterase 1 [Tabernanthe iboga]